MSASQQGNTENRSRPSSNSQSISRPSKGGHLAGRSPFATPPPDEKKDADGQQDAASPDQVNRSVARLMSETAHDLRSPLTTVRESIRLVQQGEMGELNDDQETMLAAAIDQCDCMSQMIREMVQLERLRTGAPRADRRWISLDQVRSTVDETLRPWTVPRNIDLLWDIVTDSSARVYADVSMIRRLIVNLVVNAIRVSHEGQCVLIRMVRSRDNEMIECGVVDQGPGMSAAELRDLSSDRGLASASGEGLGLTICRQLAAVHFSSLKLRSRPGDGTEVSFLLPASGPHAVATAWVNWRMALQDVRTKPKRVFTHGDSRAAESVVTTVELNHTASKPRYADCLSSAIVTLGAAVSREATQAFETTLQNRLQMFELAYKIDQRRWVVMMDADIEAAATKISDISDLMNETNGGVRTSWTDPQLIPLDRRRAISRVSDLLVREELAACSSTRVLDRNEVRPGTAPIAASPIATERLESELSRLAGQMQLQTERLRQQVKNIRLR